MLHILDNYSRPFRHSQESKQLYSSGLSPVWFPIDKTHLLFDYIGCPTSVSSHYCFVVFTLLISPMLLKAEASHSMSSAGNFVESFRNFFYTVVRPCSKIHEIVWQWTSLNRLQNRRLWYLNRHDDGFRICFGIYSCHRARRLCFPALLSTALRAALLSLTPFEAEREGHRDNLTTKATKYSKDRTKSYKWEEMWKVGISWGWSLNLTLQDDMVMQIYSNKNIEWCIKHNKENYIYFGTCLWTGKSARLFLYKQKKTFRILPILVRA